MTASDISLAIDAVWRIESAALIAGLTRMVRDVAVAEDLAQDALVAALERWPQSGIPENPGAWLMAMDRGSPGAVTLPATKTPAATRAAVTINRTARIADLLTAGRPPAGVANGAPLGAW